MVPPLLHERVHFLLLAHLVPAFDFVEGLLQGVGLDVFVQLVVQMLLDSERASYLSVLSL